MHKSKRLSIFVILICSIFLYPLISALSDPNNVINNPNTLVINLDLPEYVVGENCHSSNQFETQLIISAPETKEYKVFAKAERNGSEQLHEAYFLIIDDKKGPVSEDEQNPDNMSIDYLGDFDLKQGLNKVLIKSLALCPPDITANSVHIDTFYIIPIDNENDSTNEDNNIPDNQDNKMCQYAIRASASSENILGSLASYSVGAQDSIYVGQCDLWSGYGSSWTPENWNVSGILTLNYEKPLKVTDFTIYGDYSMCWKNMKLKNSNTGEELNVFNGAERSCTYTKSLDGTFLADTIIIQTCGDSWSSTDAVQMCGFPKLDDDNNDEEDEETNNDDDEEIIDEEDEEIEEENDEDDEDDDEDGEETSDNYAKRRVILYDPCPIEYYDNLNQVYNCPNDKDNNYNYLTNLLDKNSNKINSKITYESPVHIASDYVYGDIIKTTNNNLKSTNSYSPINTKTNSGLLIISILTTLTLVLFFIVIIAAGIKR